MLAEMGLELGWGTASAPRLGSCRPERVSWVQTGPSSMGLLLRALPVAGAVLRSPGHTEALSDPHEDMVKRKGSQPQALVEAPAIMPPR